MIYSDFPKNYTLGFQDNGTDRLLGIIDLHDNIIFYLIIITMVVIWFFFSALFNPDHMSNLHHNDNIELLWTITPAKILWLIGLPSLRLLYLLDEILDSELTIKISGNQWYWNYEYSDYNKEINFDSYKINEEDLELGELRKLTVDNYLILPINTSIRFIVTANDVLHSFAIPSFGVKVDAIPGRLNSKSVLINRPGFFFGQCSELCGALHSAMPIGIQAVSLSSYLSFINSF